MIPRNGKIAIHANEEVPGNSLKKYTLSRNAAGWKVETVASVSKLTFAIPLEKINSAETLPYEYHAFDS